MLTNTKGTIYCTIQTLSDLPLFVNKICKQNPQGSRTASTLSAATLASLGGGSSRRGSCDTSISADTEASIREMKVKLRLRVNIVKNVVVRA